MCGARRFPGNRVAVTSTTGATCSYLLSYAFGRPLVQAFYRERLLNFQAEVRKNQGKLFNYMLFLRFTPVVPNTLVNVASPIAGMPLRYFFWGTLVGQGITNFMAVNAGCRLKEMDSLGDLADRRMMAFGLFLGAVAMLPVLLERFSRREAAAEGGEKKRA